MAIFNGLYPCSQSLSAEEIVYNLWNPTLLSAMEQEKVTSTIIPFACRWVQGEGKANKTMRTLKTIFWEAEQGKKKISSQHLQAIFKHSKRLPLNSHSYLSFRLSLEITCDFLYIIAIGEWRVRTKTAACKEVSPKLNATMEKITDIVGR